MASRSDTSLAALLLAQRLVDGPATALKAAEYWSLVKQVPDPAELLGLKATAVADRAGMALPMAARIAQLLEAAPAVALRLDQLEHSGMRVVTSVDGDYPAQLVERLGSSAPPLLYAVGHLGLAEGPLLGIVGSRRVTEQGAETTRRAARRAAQHQMGIVSGGAKGVDRLAMLSGLEAGARVVGVLADSLIRVTREPELRQAVRAGTLCLCTPYRPSAGFSVANAMGRNKLIYALSVATLVVAAEARSGGTWAGAVEALRQRSAPVVAWTGQGDTSGNRELVELGAIPVDTVDTLFPLPTSGRLHSHSGEQLNLDV